MKGESFSSDDCFSNIQRHVINECFCFIFWCIFWYVISIFKSYFNSLSLPSRNNNKESWNVIWDIGLNQLIDYFRELIWYSNRFLIFWLKMKFSWTEIIPVARIFTFQFYCVLLLKSEACMTDWHEQQNHREFFKCNCKGTTKKDP